MRIILRDDDFGWEEEQFHRLHSICAEYEKTLSAAAIPQSCTDRSQWQWESASFLEITGHGYSHRNYQTEGKKAEFSTDRLLAEAKIELSAGNEFLSERYSKNYFATFIPPWNRISDKLIQILPEAGYCALSRFGSNRLNQEIPEFNAQIDLHTRREGPYESVSRIFEDIERAWHDQSEAEPRFVGVMLHHNKMSDGDFDQMEELLRELVSKKIDVVSYREQHQVWSAWREQ